MIRSSTTTFLVLVLIRSIRIIRRLPMTNNKACSFISRKHIVTVVVTVVVILIDFYHLIIGSYCGCGWCGSYDNNPRIDKGKDHQCVPKEMVLAQASNSIKQATVSGGHDSGQ